MLLVDIADVVKPHCGPRSTSAPCTVLADTWKLHGLVIKVFIELRWSCETQTKASHTNESIYSNNLRCMPRDGRLHRERLNRCSILRFLGLRETSLRWCGVPHMSTSQMSFVSRNTSPCRSTNRLTELSRSHTDLTINVVCRTVSTRSCIDRWHAWRNWCGIGAATLMQR